MKLITESPEHKDRFVRLPKNILRLDNRYPDLLPCNKPFSYLIFYF